MYQFHSIVYHLFLYFPEIGDERGENELGILSGFQSITCGFQGSYQWWTRNSQEIFCRLERREDWTDQEIAFFFSSSILSDLMTEKRTSGFLSLEIQSILFLKPRIFLSLVFFFFSGLSILKVTVRMRSWEAFSMSCTWGKGIHPKQRPFFQYDRDSIVKQE